MLIFLSKLVSNKDFFTMSDLILLTFKSCSLKTHKSVSSLLYCLRKLLSCIKIIPENWSWFTVNYPVYPIPKVLKKLHRKLVEIGHNQLYSHHNILPKKLLLTQKQIHFFRKLNKNALVQNEIFIDCSNRHSQKSRFNKVAYQLVIC